MQKSNPTLLINEEYISLKYLSLIDNNDIEYVYSILNNVDKSNYPTFFKLVIKYVINEKKVDIKDINKFIYNYSILFTSICYYNNIEDNPFKNLFNKGLLVEDILSLKDYEEELEKYKASKFSNIINNNIPFFSLSFDVKKHYEIENNNRVPFDLMVASIINNREDYIRFSFKFEKSEWDNVCTNIIGKDYGPNLDLIAFIINEINPSKPNYYDLSLKPTIFYQILSGNKGNKMSLSRITFIEKTDKDKYSINLDKVNSFRFTYNDVNYIFDNKGIRKE